MTCDRIQTELKAYDDGELRGVARWRVARHVRRCARCQQEVAALKRIGATLQTHATVPMPEGFKERVLANVGQTVSLPYTARQTDSLPYRAREGERMRGFVSLLKKREAWAAAGVLAVGTALLLMLFPAGLNTLEGPMAQKKIVRYRKWGESQGDAVTKGKEVSKFTQDYDEETKARVPRKQPTRGKSAGVSHRGGIVGNDDESNYFVGVIQTDGLKELEKKSGFVAKQIEGDPFPRSTTLHIIRTADITLRVKKFQETYDAIAREARAVGGFVADSNVTANEDESVDGTVSVSVPERFFEKVVERVSALGKLTGKKISATDVSQEYVDLESNLRNLRSEETRLLDLMNKARRLQDVLTIERELSRVRGDIEQATGRLRYLSNLTTYSTITVSLHQPGKERPKPTGWSVAGQFKQAVATLTEIGKMILTVLIYAVVFAPIYLVGLSFVFVVGKQVVELARTVSGRQ